MAANFRELLSTKTDEVDRPRALAAGHYICAIKNFEFGTSRQKQTPFVRFLLTPVEACSDVDASANAGIDLGARELRRDYYLLPHTIWRLSDALDAILGKQIGRSFDERLPDTRGARVMADVAQRESEDGSETFNDVQTLVAA